MDVLHLSAGNLFGGVESLQVTLARCRALCPQMTPHFAVCFESRLAAELRSTGSPAHVLGTVRVSRPWTVWRARRRLEALLREQRFDVVVCHSAWPHVIFGPVVRTAGLPLIFWLHDVTHGRHWLELWAKRIRPDGVICTSRFTEAGLGSLFPNMTAKVVYCPVALPQAVYSAIDRRAVRAELATCADAVVVVQVGRLAPLKGQRLCLEALSMVADVPGWICWQVGGAQRPPEQHYLDDLKAMAAQLGLAERVRFVGQRPDVPRLLAAADVYCQPNVGPDAFGLTFVEALLAGLPVVTTAIGGALEIVDSSCGILVRVADRASLANSLRRLILDSGSRIRLGAAGPARARQLCDPRQQLAGIHDYLHQFERGVAA